MQAIFHSENAVSFEFLYLTVTAYENNSILLTGTARIEAIGTDPLISISFKNSNGFMSSTFGTVALDVFFVIKNGARNYVVSNLAEFPVLISTAKEQLDYIANFTDKTTYAWSNFFKNENIQSVGVRGEFSFGLIVQDFVGAVDQKRFFSISFSGNTYVPTSIFDFAVPQDADITDANNGDKDMRKGGMPNRVSTSIGKTPVEPLSGNMYLGWQMPLTPNLLTVFPYNLIVTGFISFVVGLLVRFVYDKLRARSEKRQKEPVQKVLSERIAEHCMLLTSFMSSMAIESPKGRILSSRYVKESKEALVRYVGEIGNDVVSLNTKKAVLELERKLDALIALVSMGSYTPKEKMMETIMEALAQIAIIGRLVENDALWVIAESLHDTYKR